MPERVGEDLSEVEEGYNKYSRVEQILTEKDWSEKDISLENVLRRKGSVVLVWSMM